MKLGDPVYYSKKKWVSEYVSTVAHAINVSQGGSLVPKTGSGPASYQPLPQEIPTGAGDGHIEQIKNQVV